MDVTYKKSIITFVKMYYIITCVLYVRNKYEYVNAYY